MGNYVKQEWESGDIITVEKLNHIEDGIASMSDIPIMTPEMFYAVGDGETDDSTAIQNCITNSSIVVMTKNYKITTPIKLHSNLIIYGLGKGTIFNSTGNAIFYNAYQDVSEEDPLEPLVNVTIDGLTFIGQKTLYNGGSALPETTDCDAGIKIQRLKTVNPVAADWTRKNTNIVIKNNIFKDFGACAVRILSGYNCKIINNYITYTGTNITSSYTFGYGVSYDGENFIISDNHIENVGQGIICGLLNKNTNITNNNICTKGQHGMYIESGYNFNISHNNIHDCEICGIKI